MHVRLLLFGALLTWAVASLANAADWVVPSDRVNRWISVYSEPGADSTRIGRLRKGEHAALVRSVPFWHEVRLEDGRRGFVSKSWSRVISAGALDRDVNDLRIHFVHVGPGSCALIECPGASASPILVDCGQHFRRETNTGLSAYAAREYMRGVLEDHSAPVDVVISHADTDHYGYIPTILDDVTVRNVWKGGDADDYTQHGFDNWLSEQRTAGATIHQDLARNFHNQAPIGAPLDCGLADAFILTVNADPDDDSKNDDSLVLMIEYGDFLAILSGDAEGETEDRIRANYHPDVQATVLTGSHHGSRSHRSNSREWANSVRPLVTVYQSGYAFGHPKCDAVERYRPHLATVPDHPAQCDSEENTTPFVTDEAEYMTEAVGTVVITSGGTSPLDITCLNAPECAAAINH